MIFGGGRLLLGATALLLVAGLLAGVGLGASVPTARAATVVPCTQTFAGAVGAIRADTVNETPTDAATATVFTLTVPASSRVEDIDVTISASHANASDLRFDLDPQEGIDPDILKRNVLMNRTPGSGAQVAPLTFDDEAGPVYAATSPPGRYRPYEPLVENDGLLAGGTWRLIAYNWNATTAAKVSSWSITITYTVCDGDGDAVEDHVDNCRGLANPDQADMDGDAIGDPCDDDVDGDGVANSVDSCAVLTNPDQADLDGDGAGDACDDDRDGDGVGTGDNCPTVPNPDQLASDGDSVGDACDVDDDGDDIRDTQDSCPVLRADTASGCPAVASTLTLKKTGKRSVKGRLSADPPACRSRRDVSVWKQRKGKDRRIDQARSSASGRFRVTIGRRTGTFYARATMSVVVGVAECSSDRSRKLTVRR